MASSPLAQCHRWVQSVSFPSHPALPLYAIPCLLTMCEDGLIPKHSVTPLRLCWDSGPWSHRRGRRAHGLNFSCQPGIHHRLPVPLRAPRGQVFGENTLRVLASPASRGSIYQARRPSNSLDPTPYFADGVTEAQSRALIFSGSVTKLVRLLHSFIYSFINSFVSWPHKLTLQSAGRFR